VDIEAGLTQCKGSSQAADPRSDDENARGPLLSGVVDLRTDARRSDAGADALERPHHG